MKVNDLRIGNYVNRLGELTTITAIQIDSDELGYVSTPKSGAITANQIEPVRLTKEWLSKFGFTFRNSQICSPPNCWHEYEVFGNEMTDSIRMSLQSKDIVVFAIINYVHELQNLYHALTGKELYLALRLTDRNYARVRGGLTRT